MRYLSRFLMLSAIALCVLASYPPESRAKSRRALVVGINAYQPSGITAPESAQTKTIEEKAVSSSSMSKGRGACMTLDGAVNDATAMREILIAKYDFKPENILILKDSEATRDRILTEIQKHLIDPAVAGDIGFFFFAGHGSQVVNSKSTKADRLDETIVPADSIRGVPDIRDKELSRIFNKALDKGVILTAVFDSCHSGSIARGLESPGKTRYCSLDKRDVADPPDPVPTPEERGALIFSAAQDYQEAKEAPGGEHGAFTFALLSALQTSTADESAERIFLQVKALLQTGGSRQEPVLAGPADRRKRPFLGEEGNAFAGRTTVAVLKIGESGEVELQGGLAVGLNRNCELKKIGGAQGKTIVRIRVTKIEGLTRAKAEGIEGNVKEIKPGDLFEVDRWAPSYEASLRVWLPPALGNEELSRIKQEMSKLRQLAQIQWIDDPVKETPTHVMSWDSSAWKLKHAGEQRAESLGKTPSVEMILEKLTSGAKGKAKFFVDFPPPAGLTKELQLGVGTTNSSIQVTASSEQADYQLVGRVGEKELEYAWVRPGVTDEDAEKLNLPLPVRTDWIGIQSTLDITARTLEDYALRIGKVKAWLQIMPPPDKGYFPYRLALKNAKTGEIKTEGTVFNGDSYGLVLQADEGKLKSWVDKHFVYVFTIDRNGNTMLLFPPREAGSVGNRVPYDIVGQDKYPTEIQLGNLSLFEISAPFGVDTYILLASEEAIPNPDALEFKGVRTRGRGPADEGSQNPLAKLLYSAGSATRGADPAAPTNWSIQRLMVRSAPQSK